MKYTKFGELFRIYRIKKGETLHDASVLLGVTNSFVSAVELGKKKVPESWLEIISSHYKLTEEETKELEEAIKESSTNIKIELIGSTLFQRNLAFAFQRSFDDVSEEKANEIIEILKRGDNDGLQDEEHI